MNVAHLYAALRLVWNASRRWTILLLTVQLLQAFLPLVNLYLIKLIVDTLTETDLAALDFSEIVRYVLAFGAVQLLLALLQNYEQLISETQQQLVVDHLSTLLIDKATELDLSYYENATYHDTFHLAQQQALYRPVQLLQGLAAMLRSGLLLLSLAGLLFYLHWAVAFVLFFFALPVAGVKWYYAKRLFLWEKSRTSLEREAYHVNQILTTEPFAKEVRIFGLKLPLKQRFIDVRRRLFFENYRIKRQRAHAGFLARSAEVVAMTLTYAFVCYETFQGRITIGELVMYFQGFQRGLVAVQQLLTGAVQLYANRLFVTHLFDLLRIPSRLQSPPGAPPEVPRLRAAVEVRALSFTYPDTTTEVLHDVNLKFRRGQVVALVGENGSGKTTLVKLLCRLYDPTRGRIEWDGTDLRKFSLAALRRRISVIYQDFARYPLTVGENIRLADWNRTPADGTAPADETELRAAARRSGAARFVERFPEGYDQPLTRYFNRGVELSGGQWQKVALTRAFYKDADLIVLDEPSSAIDPLAEADIFRHFRAMADERIVLLVTHRLYNLRIADRIVVLHEGRVVETGTHTELMKNGGRYATMFAKQAVGAEPVE